MRPDLVLFKVLKSRVLSEHKGLTQLWDCHWQAQVEPLS